MCLRTNLDSFVDFLLSIDMLPAFELGFMPDWLASVPSNCTYEIGYGYRSNVSPPKELNLWHNLIAEFTQHLVDRYSLGVVETFLFEVWNEPQWQYHGTMDQYLDLFKATAAAVHSVSPRLHVGGPATSVDMVSVGPTTPNFGTSWLANFTARIRNSTGMEPNSNTEPNPA